MLRGALMPTEFVSWDLRTCCLVLKAEVEVLLCDRLLFGHSGPWQFSEKAVGITCWGVRFHLFRTIQNLHQMMH